MKSTNEERRDERLDYDVVPLEIWPRPCACGEGSLCPRRQGKACPMADEGDEDE